MIFNSPDTLYVLISVFFAVAAMSVALAVVAVARVARQPHVARPAVRRRASLTAKPAGQMA